MMNFTYLEHFLENMVADGRTPGCGVLVMHEGKDIFRKTIGVSNVEQQIPFSGEEMLYVYSCSKIATVTAALTLLEQGKFLLSDPLYEYIPEYRHMKVKSEDGGVVEAKNPITIQNLFNMTAGLDYDRSSPCFEKAGKLTNGAYDTVETVKAMAEKVLCFEPGTHWQYSLCHDVLAGLVSVISGMKFRDYVKKTIFEPLDMQNTVYHATSELLPKIAPQYRFVPYEGPVITDIVEAQMQGSNSAGSFEYAGKDNSHIFGPEYDSGGAGIITTMEDYSKLLAALANSGVGVNGNRILSSNTIELMRTNTLSPEQLIDFNREPWKPLWGYGYGLGVRTMINRVKGSSLSPVGEFGWCGAAGSAAFIDPDNKLSAFFVQHTLNPREEYYMPRLRNVIYAGMK